MDLSHVVEEENKDIIPRFVYGLIALLGIFILFTLIRIIYHLYKVRKEVNLEVIEEDDVDTESHSVSIRSSALNRQEVDNNSVSDSERLRIQLDKLRRLLNRLNAMGTFSRDTIGDLSAQSMAYVNNSRAVSSDLSNFWSSIDFDDFDESTVNGSNFLRTPTEKSVSLSISDISQDTTEMHFDSNKTASTTSALLHHTNASNAIAQILTILNSMTLKSRHDTQRAKSSLKNQRNSNKYSNIQDFQSSSKLKYYTEIATSHNSTMLSSSSEAMHNKLSSSCTSENSNTLISTPEIRESGISTADMKLVDKTLSSETKILEQLSKIILSNFVLSASGSSETKISKAMSCEETLSSASIAKNELITNLSTSKSLDFDTFLKSTSVSSRINPVTVLPERILKHVHSSETMSDDVAAAESNMKQSIRNSSELSSELSFTEENYFTSDKGTLNRSVSHSSVSDTRLSLLPSKLNSKVNMHSYAEPLETPNSFFESTPYIEITIPEPLHSSDSYPHQKVDELSGESKNSKNGMIIVNKNVGCISSKSLNILLPVGTETFKSSTSETELKQAQYLGMLSPNISYSGSDTFLSPNVTENSSPVDKIDWKSPAEPTSTISLPSNFTPCTKNTMLSRSSCIWFTPPSPTQ